VAIDTKAARDRRYTNSRRGISPASVPVSESPEIDPKEVKIAQTWAGAEVQLKGTIEALLLLVTRSPELSLAFSRVWVDW
jgi:hypothetical protein